MASGTSLAHPNACEYNGILYLVGYRDGAQYLRRSADRGATWLPFSDSSVEKQVASPAADERAAIVKLDTQGRPLLMAVGTDSGIDVYVSKDEGETWQLESHV